MSTRKRWKIVSMPGAYEQRCDSQPDAYRSIERYRELSANGRLRIDRISVYFTETQGRAGLVWRLFETVRFGAKS